MSPDDAQPEVVPVLEVGGTHVTAALVRTGNWTLAAPAVRRHLDADGPADAILKTFTMAAEAMLETVPEIVPETAPGDGSERLGGAIWSVAIPDPFDYAAGVGRFHGVAKFEALDGVSVRDELLARLPGAPSSIMFLNDADAFTLGEWTAGAGIGADRVLGLTLGTGVGSGWVVGGRVVVPDSPPGGRAHLLLAGGQPLEETMSRRAIRRAYGAATGDTAADVADIAVRARGGEQAAIAVLRAALTGLGATLAGPIRAFAPDVIVVGGSMARSWDLLGPWFEPAAGVRPAGVRPASLPDTAGLIGAAHLLRR